MGNFCLAPKPECGSILSRSERRVVAGRWPIWKLLSAVRDELALAISHAIAARARSEPTLNA
jgi:hypothetical protein